MSFILNSFNDWIKNFLIGCITGNLTGMFDDVNSRVGSIASQVGQTPDGWNANIFSMVQNLSQTVIIPIAGMILTFVVCYELISMIIEKNNMHEGVCFKGCFTSNSIQHSQLIYGKVNRTYAGKAVIPCSKLLAARLRLWLNLAWLPESTAYRRGQERRSRSSRPLIALVRCATSVRFEGGFLRFFGPVARFAGPSMEKDG